MNENIDYNNTEVVIDNICRCYPNANREVIEFICNFAYHDKSPDDVEIIRKQFRCGYCFYFANILKIAFNRGEVCWCAPYGHICWVDEDGIPYDIEGVCESDCDYYIPISYLGDAVLDFMHIPNKTFNASEEDIQRIIKAYEHDIGIKTKEV